MLPPTPGLSHLRWKAATTPWTSPGPRAGRRRRRLATTPAVTNPAPQEAEAESMILVSGQRVAVYGLRWADCRAGPGLPPRPPRYSQATQHTSNYRCSSSSHLSSCPGRKEAPETIQRSGDGAVPMDKVSCSDMDEQQVLLPLQVDEHETSWLASHSSQQHCCDVLKPPVPHVQYLHLNVTSVSCGLAGHLRPWWCSWMCYTSPPRLLGRFGACGVHARQRDDARRNYDVAVWMCGVPRRLDGIQAQPRRPLITASATTSLVVDPCLSSLRAQALSAVGSFS